MHLYPLWAHSLPDLDLYSLGEDMTLSTAVQGIGSPGRWDWGMQAIHILLHFPQCQTNLFDRAMTQGMDAVPHP
jgi:hypothetical protein